MLYMEILIKFLILTNIDEDIDDPLREAEQQVHEFLNTNFLNIDKRFNLLYYKKIMTRLLNKTPAKFQKLFRLLCELCDTMRADFLQIHLSAIDAETKNLSDSCLTQADMHNMSKSSIFRNLCKLTGSLFLYKVKPNDTHEIELFKVMFERILSIFFKAFSSDLSASDRLERIRTREKLLGDLSLSLLHMDENDGYISQTILDVFLQLQYSFTIRDVSKRFDKYPLFSIVKEYYIIAAEENKNNICWKYLFFYCYFEKKDLIRCLIVSRFIFFQPFF
jgi:hypothetical protein